ncbi:hypothetical protein LMG31506_01750 [Cupriavidus yeoncheonensis]|uniref:Uncharacterized protein n=1 Tax=Cupriavidus yeoncheonensis TaxID=1462994 RepID=A0A916IV62_9BURK|nr:hypothetical protein [Cupriavidus yeoncheonensis]CAG2136911.1 hypothetical protein LMG31506_01750 [Cupriavidus yeoncheonensis]
MQPTNFVWHYTVGTRLPAIAESAVLIPARSLHATASLGVLWFSRQQTWEPSTARTGWKRHPANKMALPEKEGLFRFGLPAADSRLVPWPGVTRLADIDIPEAMSMVSAGLRRGASPTDWLGVLTQVPLAELRFQRWDGTAWCDARMDDIDLAALAAMRPAVPPEHGRRIPMTATHAGAMHDVH